MIKKGRFFQRNTEAKSHKRITRKRNDASNAAVPFCFDLTLEPISYNVSFKVHFNKGGESLGEI